ncbi:O-antigen ligase family protein [Sphingomonas sp. C3-2]|uniref:O-antigen ligase family protein n=1 Tax=Sphingomonas sp. C3-2 TaxID=3062169 RepID=UPI00294AB052|nr:O-antigen ligase family protein [Sphingomonas sp. C3-2]WOK36508.1 O-antigen ligase family protein [Sphingomonas sp. C3-2]
MYRTIPPSAPALLSWQLARPFILAGAFFCPYISWRPSEMLFTLSDGLFVIGIALVILARRMPLQPFNDSTPLWLLTSAALVIGLFIGSMANGVLDRWLVAGLQYLFSLILLPMILMGQGERRTYALLKASLAGVVAMELFGAAAYFVYDGSYLELQRFSHEFVTGAGRLTAFLGDANWNAAVIAMALPCALYLRLKRQISAAAAGFSVTILIIGMVLTASFTGTVTAALGVLFFLVIGKVRPSFHFVLAGLAAITIMFSMGYGLPKAFENRVAPALEQGDLQQAGTFSDRAELMREAWGIVENRMVVGLGVDQYRKMSKDGAPVHNIYLLLWAEGGLISLFGWLGLMILLAVRAIRAVPQDRLAAALGLSVLLTFVAFSNAAPHMYARAWIAPLLLGMAPCFYLARPVAMPERAWQRWSAGALLSKPRFR